MVALADAYKMAFEAYNQRNLGQAENICTQILQQVNNHPETMFLLANIKKDQKQLGDARTLLEKLDKSHPNNFRVLCAMGQVEEDLSRLDQALVYFKKALDIEKKDPSPRYFYAAMLEKTNQVDKAKEALQPLINNNPSPAMQILHAKLLMRDKAYEEAIDALKNAKEDELNLEAKAQKYFLLGRSYDQAGQYNEAFKALCQANDYKRQRAQDPSYMETIHAYRSVLEHLPAKNDGIKQKVNVHFLVGFPRSGTTLLHQMLESHPKLVVLAEVSIVELILKSMNQQYGESITKIPHLNEEQLNSIQDVYLQFLKEYLENFEGYDSYSEDVIYIDKLPMNMVHAGFIHSFFPDSKFILSLRHPCDSAVSNFMQNFKANPAMNMMSDFDNISKLYQESFDLFFDLKEQCNLDVHEVRYEDLIDDFEKELKPVCQFLGVEFSEEMKRYRDNITEGKVINTPSYQQVIKPLYKDSQNRWKNYEEYLEPYMERYDPYLKKFGYQS